jgi:membrane associated rhomboid family serine protease
MFIPIGDEPNPRGRAWVNWGLIAINVAVFALFAVPTMHVAASAADPMYAEYLRYLDHVGGVASGISKYDLIVFHYGYRPSDSSILTLFTSMFMHGGWMHLIGNMLFLYIYGDNVEAKMGRLGYLVTYLGCGAASTFFFSLFAHGSPTPLVGASGAISGVLGLYFVWFPHNVVKMLMVFGFANVIRMPARWVLGFYLVVDNLLPFIMGPANGGGVAHGAHIGGFIAGFALAYGLQKAGGSGSVTVSQPSFTPVEENVRVRLNGPRAFREAMAQGDWPAVYNAYVTMSDTERDGIDKGDALRFADWLTDQGDYDVALALLRRFIDTQSGDAQWQARAHLRAGLIDLHFKNDAAQATDHFYRVLELGASSEMQQVARNAIAQAQSQTGRFLN